MFTAVFFLLLHQYPIKPMNFLSAAFLFVCPMVLAWLDYQMIGAVVEHAHAHPIFE